MKTFGKYRLVEHLASGGMADVWRAELPGAQGFVKEVALKLVRGDRHGDAEFVRMFVEEARLASRLGHANIVQVFDFDAIDGQYYLAMELVRGRTLRDVVDRCRERGIRFGVARAVHVGAEVARALAYAHRLEDGGRPAGLVHRDVSPHNVLLSFEGEVKLTDFGIARAAGGAEETRPGTIKGKLAYVAPEQARAERVDARADVFSLGVVLWELLTGRRLFARDSDAATLAAVLQPTPVSRPSEWNEEVPPELDELVLAALEREPGRRLASADSLAERLASVRLRLATDPADLDLRALMRRLWPEGEGERRRPEPTAVRPAPADAADAPTRTSARPRRRRRVWAAAAVVLVAAGSGGAAWKLRSTSPPTVAPMPIAAPTPAAPTPPLTVAPTPAAPTPPPTVASTPTPDQTVAPTAAPTATLAVNVSPWATIYVDGERVGDTPLAVPVSPGVHRIRAVHPRAGAAEEVLELAPGERRTWRPRLVP